MEPNFNSINTGIRKMYLLFCLGMIAMLLYSCESTTVLLANFNLESVGSPPNTAQPTGTLTLNKGSGLITVVTAPPGVTTPNKWALISHPAQPAPETELIGNFTQWGMGSYGLLCSMNIPSSSGVVSVQFDAATGLGSFMHIDFMPEGDLRIDDNESLRFGTYPRGANFVLSVALVITETTATADITLLGDGASGNKLVTVNPALLTVAKQFGKCTFWVGFQHNSSFYVDDILVTRKK